MAVESPYCRLVGRREQGEAEKNARQEADTQCRREETREGRKRSRTPGREQGVRETASGILREPLWCCLAFPKDVSKERGLRGGLLSLKRCRLSERHRCSHVHRALLFKGLLQILSFQKSPKARCCYL